LFPVRFDRHSLIAGVLAMIPDEIEHLVMTIDMWKEFVRPDLYNRPPASEILDELVAHLKEAKRRLNRIADPRRN